VAQAQQPNKQIAGDRLLKTLGIDLIQWTVGDRRIALLGIGIGLTIVIISILGYVFGGEWTGLTKPRRTFWDWLSLLIVPLVLVLGGDLFNRSESRRTKDDAEQQRKADRQIADERRQDDTLQAYIDGMSQLLTDIELPLHRAQRGDSLSTVARARTLTVLGRLDSVRKRSVLQFLYESGLIYKEHTLLGLIERRHNIISLQQADLHGADLGEANLGGANMRDANLRDAYLAGATGMTNEELGRQASSLEGATMPNGQKYEDWLKSKGREQDGKNDGS
jgi:hypothetical protein